MSSTSGADSTKAAVLKFLDEQQRPYSLADILEKVKDLGKSSVQKALDSLVSRGRIIEKVYGKQKIYCIAQSSAKEDGGQELDEIMRKLDADSRRLREELTQKQQQIRGLESELTEMSSQMTVEEALQEIEVLEQAIQRGQDQLDELRNSQEESPGLELDKDVLEQKYERYLTAYRKRKRICTDLIGHIMEGYPKSKQHLLEDIGIETDEAVDFRLD